MFSIKDIMYITSLSRFAITKCIKKIYPEKIKNGKKTELTKEEFLIILNNLRIKNFIEAYKKYENLINLKDKYESI